MRGWGIRGQVGRTFIEVGVFPWRWQIHSDLSSPRLYGIGFYITRAWA